MRKIIHDPKPGDRREKEAFLWFPRRIGDTLRWLEWAKWREYWLEGWESWIGGEWLDLEEEK